jgi:hypothetical protein
MTGSPVLAFLLSTSHRDRPSGVEDLCNVDVALSAWELACHALPTTVFAAHSRFALSVSARYRLPQTVASGTQRARWRHSATSTPRPCLPVVDELHSLVIRSCGLAPKPIVTCVFGSRQFSSLHAIFGVHVPSVCPVEVTLYGPNLG